MSASVKDKIYLATGRSGYVLGKSIYDKVWWKYIDGQLLWLGNGATNKQKEKVAALFQGTLV